MENDKKVSICIPFCGFYESAASGMIDDEIEQMFDYSDGGGMSNIPDETYWSKEFSINHHAIQLDFCAAYVDAFNDMFESETGIALNLGFETMTSPREYNFETDRIFAFITPEAVKAMFDASADDEHKTLGEVIHDRHTSYDGFYSYYTNEVDIWLMKGFKQFDHNELQTLLIAVLKINGVDMDDFDTWDLMDRYRGNGGISDAVWTNTPAKVCEFAELQREHGKPLDFEVFIETGAAWNHESDEPCPPLRCKETLELSL